GAECGGEQHAGWRFTENPQSARAVWASPLVSASARIAAAARKVLFAKRPLFLSLMVISNLLFWPVTDEKRRFSIEIASPVPDRRGPSHPRQGHVNAPRLKYLSPD